MGQLGQTQASKESIYGYAPVHWNDQSTNGLTKHLAKHLTKCHQKKYKNQCYLTVHSVDYLTECLNVFTKNLRSELVIFS